MHISVCIQDPTHTETTYLYEAILAAALKASHWRGLYAFATHDGVDHLIKDNIVHDLINRGGEIDLVVGIDAVTNRATLERMQEFEHQHANFRTKVFWNEHPGLFHPKISDFRLIGGGRVLIVGSGNLTLGGLMKNFEAYTIITATHGDGIDIGAVEEFLERHGNGIKHIDEEVLEHAARNIVRPIDGARRRRVRIRRLELASSAPGARAAAGFDRILLAQVPAAGDRWSQVHFNAEVIAQYFRMHRLETERVCLTPVSADAKRDKAEIRRCVFSAANKNHKIEIGAAKNLTYPQDGRPLLIFRERVLRTYDYMLLMPGEDGYGSVLELSDRLPSLGQGFPRSITDMDELRQAWPACRLLHVPEVDDSGL